MPKPKSSAPVVSTLAVVPKTKQKKAKQASWMTPYLSLTIDPANASTQAAQRPDLNSIPTVVWRESDNITFTTDAQGNFWIDFLPQLVNMYRTKTLSAASPPAITATGNNSVVNYAELLTTFSSWRPYSISVEMEYVGRQDECKGVFGVATTGSMPIVTDTTSMLYDEYDYKEVSAQTGGIAGALRLQDNEDFSALDAGVDINPNQYVSLIALGLPASTACLRLRYTIVGEFAVGHSKLMSRSTSHSYVRPSEVHAASNIIGPNATTAAGKEPYKELVSYAKKAVSLGAVLNNLYQDNRTAITAGVEFLGMLA